MAEQFLRSGVSLKAFNTFGIDVRAAQFAEFTDAETLRTGIRAAEYEPWMLGGGSNILLVGDVRKTVLRSAIQGISVAEENADSVVLKIGAGVSWHALVTYCVRADLGGVENLALIPGSVGAAPLQNIGAYGVELKEVFLRLEAVRIADGALEVFDNTACAFGYRESVFKHDLKGQYCITYVYLRLTKPAHRIEMSYGAIGETLAEHGVENPTIADIYNAVIAIRSSKLPDPAELGNAGSFFKNPVVDASLYETLLSAHPTMPAYPNGEQWKIPAGWLIEQAGWKGKRVGNAGCHAKQALVIVNYGSASGHEIYDFAMQVIASVQEQFGIALSPEVNIIGGE